MDTSNQFQGKTVFEGQDVTAEGPIAITIAASENRPQEKIVLNGTMGLKCKLNCITCSVHCNSIGLLVNMAEHKVESLVDSGVLHNFESKTLVNCF